MLVQLGPVQSVGFLKLLILLMGIFFVLFPEFKDQWTTEEIQILERYFDLKVSIRLSRPVCCF